MKNPRHQNGGQIQAQDERFPKLEDKFVDLVIFGNNAKMGDRIPEGTIRDKDFKKYYRNLPTRMNAQEIGNAAQSIAAFNKGRAKLKAMHKQKIRQKRKGL